MLTLGAEGVWTESWLRKEVGAAGGRDGAWEEMGAGPGLVLATHLPLCGATTPHWVA